jgi:uncharacterized protein (UPF0276 family)
VHPLDNRDSGIGVGLRGPYFSLFSENSSPSTVQWVEVISENYMNWAKVSAFRPLANLEKVRRNLPVILHGVSLSIGSCSPLNIPYLQSLKDLVEAIQPPWISDHLCWTGVHGQNLHDLLPLPYTTETLALVVRKVAQTQEFLKRPILLENPSTYLQFSHDEMTEWEFLAEVSKQSGCGLLLDINNVYVNATNNGLNPKTYLENLPHQAIGQIHLAGHTNKGSHLIDTHDEPICDAVWELYHWFTQKFGLFSTMIERDDNFPEWHELEAELNRVASLRADARKDLAS